MNFKFSLHYFVTITLLFVVILSKNLSAQVVGTDAFIRGNFVEIGISGPGGYEGATAVPPVGMHPRGGFGLFGFVADPLASGWTNYNGDFFTPGSPENGWGLQVGNTALSPMFSNNANSGSTIPGNISSYTTLLDCRNIFWNGALASGTTVIAANINYFLDVTQYFYTTTVKLTNNSASTIPMLYYYRNVDPDNNQSLSGNFSTTNVIENQPGAGPCNLACVSASQPATVGSGASYMAFAGLDPEFRVSRGGFSNRSGFDIWNGTGGLTGTLGSTMLADEAISIAFRIQNFLPGETRTFKFVTILKASDKNFAVNNLFSLSYPGALLVAPAACAAVNPPDTVKFCLPTKVEITGPGLTNFSWSWSPTIGLSGSTSYSAMVNPLVTTKYLITGVPTNTCISGTIVYTIVAVPKIFTVTIVPSTTVCPGSIITLTASGAGIGGTYAWTGPNLFSSAIQSPTINPSVLASAGIYTAVMTTSAGCIVTATTNINVLNVISTFAIPSATQCLTGNSFNFNNTGTAGGTHSYSFLPAIGAPPAGATANYAGSFTLPGTYVVTHVVTLNGCSSTSTMAVVVNPPPSATLSFTNPSCGMSNGVIAINNTSPVGQTVVGFATNLGVIAGQIITGLSAPSSPIITLTNNFGCTFTVTTTLSTSPPPSGITLTPANSSCGLSNGTISYSGVIGGTPTYSYSLNGGAFSSSTTVTGLLSGTYSVTVKDAGGCTFTKTVTILPSPGPTTITGTPVAAGCSLSNGSFNVTGVTGGTPAYSFSVDAVGTGSLTAGLAGGTHTITVRDINGCLYSTTFFVPSTVGPTSATVTTSPASCALANGSATVTTVLGGTPGYQYSFNGGGTYAVGTSTAGVAAGLHTVIIRDANSCTLSVVYNVLNTLAPTAAITASINVTCFGSNDGSFTVTGVGGSGAPYTYSLSVPFIVNGTGYFGGLPQGTYNVTLRDVLGCTTTASVTISQPAALTLLPTSIAAKCFGTNTGTINIVGAGGTGAYMYNLNGGGFQAANTFTAVGAGTYIVGIRDGNLCITTQTVTVSQPAALAVGLTPQNANCTAANGIITSTVTGGTPIYIYAWTGGGGAGSTTNPLVAGTYSLTVTDSKGCVFNTFATIGVTPGGTAAITSPSNNVTCNGANDGRLTASPTGGTGPYSYLWSPGGQITQTASGLAPATYTCVITDFYGCKASVVGTITQPFVLTVLINSNNAKCFGTPTGTVTAAGSGGTAPYSYLWPALSSTLSTVNNVAIGTYTCIVTDASGCTRTASIVVNQPTAIALTSTATAANCLLPNGSATVTASGGTPAYTYTWSTGSTLPTISGQFAGTYTVTVKDGNNCLQTLSSTINNLSGPTISISSQTNVSCFGGSNGLATALGAGGTGGYIYTWSNGNATPTAGGLSAGIYTVSVTDAAGCLASTAVTITQPVALTVTITPTHPKCFGSFNGTGLAAAFGGTPVYTYAWTGGGGTAALTTPLGAGNYGLIVTDSKGCTATASMTLVNPPAMSASTTFTNVSCFGLCNAIAVGSATNAIGIVSYYWTGGLSPISNQTASGLCAGTYTLLATDQNSCTANSIINVTQPPVLTAAIGLTGSVTCNGGTNGFTSVTPAGGTPTYSYTWSGAAGAAGNSSTANTLPAGVYTVTVSDTKGCSTTAVATILQPAAFATTLTTTNVKCNGVCDGTANIAFAGGAGTTTFLWQPGLQSGNFVTNLCAGGQTVTITSNGSCPTILTFTLTQPALLTSAITATNSNCGFSNGKTAATVGGGTAPYSYLWSNGVTTLSNFGILAGAYTFTVTDANLCKSVGSGLINDNTGPVVAILGFTNVSCFGGNDGAATTTISGGAAPYTIWWSGNPAITQNVSNFTAGLENITVVDNNGCIGTASVSITQPTALVTAIGSFTDVTCFGLTNGGATMLANGGTLGYNYLWTPSGQTSAMMVNVGANTYTCLVTDAKNCTSSKVVTINQPAQLIIGPTTFSNISCFGGSNGLITTSPSGGTPGYTYSWTPTQPNSGVIGGLAAGPYALTITDTKLCSINANFTILQPSALTSTYSSLPAKCGIANGSATISVGGGTPGYTINWNTAPAQVGTIATSMAPGSWLGVITDSQGCSLTQTVIVANALPPTITSFVTAQPKCFGMANGSITVNYTGGTSPYTVSWSNPISVVAPGLVVLSHSVTGVTSGAYTATVTDSYGCMHAMPVNLTQPSLLTMSVNRDTTICYGQSVQIWAQGLPGTAPYTYSWTPASIVGSGPHTVNPLTPTPYSVFVTDANGCTTSPKIITVNVTPQLLIATTSNTLCHGDNIVLGPSITSPGKGGPYTYLWNTSETTPTKVAVGNYSATTNNYTVTVSDGCSLPATGVFTLVVNPIPVISFVSDKLNGCAPLAITLTGTSNGIGDNFQWSAGNNLNFSGNPKSVTLADSGKYTITLVVTSTLTGCKATLIKNNYIEVYPMPIASFYSDPSTTTILSPTFNFTNTSQGAVGYNWNFGDPMAIGGTNTSILINPSHSYANAGIYTVYLEVTSIKGCKDNTSLQVEVTPDFALYVPNTFTPDGNGLNDVFLPMGVGIDEDNYRMDIFDRWGEQIFTSNSFRKGWDGSVKGNKIGQNGVYVYKITVYDMKGNKHPYVGHVTLLNNN